VLRLFTPEEPWLSLSEIALRAGLSKATALRFVSTLKALGYLEQSAQTKHYRPSLAVLDLGYAALASLDLRELALPVLQRLSATTGELADMGVLAGTEIVWIECVKMKDLLSTRIEVGTRLPAYCTAMGKVLLASLLPDHRERVLAQMELTAHGPNTITSMERLRAELDRVQMQGYAVQDEEVMAGSRTVAAPVFDRAGEAIAAINVAGTTARISLDDLHGRLRAAVTAGAAEISALLGWRPSTASGQSDSGPAERRWPGLRVAR
jgi:IclR family pca regulon transcriptional regulator